MRTYRSDDEDSSRWEGFPFRAGDIVISTRSKSGTTWMQMICALLVHRTPDLPAPLSELSPWLDHLIRPRDEVVAALEAQPFRRVIKTHTPLDGVPVDARATYVVVARHPLDMAVSMYHQSANIDRERLRELTGAGEARVLPPLDEWLPRWVTRDSGYLDSLPGVLAHLTDAWHRRHEPNVVLVHYDDLRADLAGRMAELAARLHLDPPTPDLVEAATFERMRVRATELAPNAQGVLKSPRAFFRRGSSGAGREALGEAGLAAYDRRTRELAAPDLLAWLHR
ncbi:sulfotransferase domain-containing protein [Virgisporangium ochraceum]|uniref:Glycolipid sulfotransferase n=1 Tax=Virgisporangium ochraceum TaxID=65505 RepID=A0A8J3ZR11_9ACTN|nr:sulfotransferase domain-containing protein [Virgisporangium ochraceum]GIJ65961.1 glycolipid sulfotransferase [Virgisporangium ochraceum]